MNVTDVGATGIAVAVGALLLAAAVVCYAQQAGKPTRTATQRALRAVLLNKMGKEWRVFWPVGGDDGGETKSADTTGVKTAIEKWAGKSFNFGSHRTDEYWSHSDAVGIKLRSGRTMEVKLRTWVKSEAGVDNIEKWEKDALRGSSAADVEEFLRRHKVDSDVTKAALSALVKVLVTKQQCKISNAGCVIEHSTVDAVVVLPDKTKLASQGWQSVSVESRKKATIAAGVKSLTEAGILPVDVPGYMCGGYPAWVKSLADTAITEAAAAATAGST